MRHITTALSSTATSTAIAAAVACAALLASPLAQADDFTLQGLITDGPLAGTAFIGSFSYDPGALLPGASVELPLSAFTLQIGVSLYTLASADQAPAAVFSLGDFVGLSYADTSSANLLQRPWVALVPGFDSFADAYLAYVSTADKAGATSGFGSYSVAVVPEPASVALWLAGLAGLSGLAGLRAVKRRRLATRAAVQGQ